MWDDVLTVEDYRGADPLIWAHVAMHGEVKLNMSDRLNPRRLGTAEMGTTGDGDDRVAGSGQDAASARCRGVRAVIMARTTSARAWIAAVTAISAGIEWA